MLIGSENGWDVINGGSAMLAAAVTQNINTDNDPIIGKATLINFFFIFTSSQPPLMMVGKVDSNESARTSINFIKAIFGYNFNRF
jgi:hypothetical protein